MSELRLKWREAFGLGSGLRSMLNDGLLMDVTLLCQGERIQAHKIVLAACSLLFRQIFMDNICQHPVVFMQETPVHHLKALIRFMYTGETAIHQKDFANLMRTAAALKMSGLTFSHKQAKPSKNNSKPEEGNSSLPNLIPPDSAGWHNVAPKLELDADVSDERQIIFTGENDGEGGDEQMETSQLSVFVEPSQFMAVDVPDHNLQPGEAASFAGQSEASHGYQQRTRDPLMVQRVNYLQPQADFSQPGRCTVVNEYGEKLQSLLGQHVIGKKLLLCSVLNEKMRTKLVNIVAEKIVEDNMNDQGNILTVFYEEYTKWALEIKALFKKEATETYVARKIVNGKICGSTRGKLFARVAKIKQKIRAIEKFAS